MTDRKRGSREANDVASAGTSTRVARVTAAIALVLAGLHILMTAVFNVPYPTIKYDVLPGRIADQYIRPYLVQDYRIFAPNPANTDRNLWVRAWVEKPDGQRVEGPWIDATSVELAAGYRRVLRKQLSVLGTERLMSAYNDLTPSQKEVAKRNFHRAGDLTPLLEALKEADDSNIAAVNQYVRVNNFITSYATQVAYTMWGDEGEIVAVQFRSVSSPVIPWEQRLDDDAERPKSTYTPLGWLPAMEWPTQDREAFAGSFRGWAEKAGAPVDLGDDEDAPAGQEQTAGGDDAAGAGGEE